MLPDFVGEERRVDAAEHDEGAPAPRETPDLVATQHIGGVNADADDITRPDAVQIERLERFVDDNRRAEAGRRRGGKHEEPARRDHRGSEREIAGIDEMYSH